MEKRNILVWLALGAVVVGLAAVALEMREDDQPQTLTPRIDQPAPRERRPSKRHAQSETHFAPAEPTDYRGCEHPLIPSMRGEWREYRWEQTHTEEDVSGEMRIEAASARELDDGQGEITWRIRMSAGARSEPR